VCREIWIYSFICTSRVARHAITCLEYSVSRVRKYVPPTSEVATDVLVHKPYVDFTSMCNDTSTATCTRSVVNLPGGSSMQHQGGQKSGSSGKNRSVHHEDLLIRSWRSTAHGVALVTAKAERIVTVAAASLSTDNNPSLQESAMKDLNDATIGFLRNHFEWGRTISYLEAKLEGKAAEMEAMQHYLRSQPSLGRKRKRSDKG
jgi:hypothetical protein